MSEQDHYLYNIVELYEKGILTQTEAKNAEKRAMKKLGYRWRSWIR